MVATVVESGGLRAGATRGMLVTGNEAAKAVRLLWRRRSLLISGVVSNALYYLALRFFVGGGHVTRELVAITLPALVATFAATSAALQASGAIAEEINGGTLEQSQLSPAHPAFLLAGRVVGLAGEGVAGGFVLGLVFGLWFHVGYQVRPGVFLPALLTLLDALGYALLVAGLTIRVASIGAVAHVFNMTIEFFGGMLVPVAVFPHAIEIAARFAPITLGAEVLTGSLHGQRLSSAWSHGMLAWLVLHACAMISLGWAVYLRNLRRARREGGLTPR